MEYVQKLALQDSFDARGVFIPAGHIGSFDADKIEPEKDKHLIDPGELGEPAMVQISVIAPTGPNPVTPQQLPPGAVQGPAGTYLTPGKVLVSEVTKTAEQRIEEPRLDDVDREDEVNKALASAAENAGVTIGPATTTIPGTAPALENNNDALVDGTVAEVTADLGTKTDAELTQMRAAEVDRERPRRGVISAIDAELENRQNA